MSLFPSYQTIVDLINNAVGTISLAWDNITGKPSEFPPEDHTHVTADITDLSMTLDGKANLVGGNTFSDPQTFNGTSRFVDQVTLGNFATSKVGLLNFVAPGGQVATLVNTFGSAVTLSLPTTASAGTIIATTDGTETLSHKTLAAPILSNAVLGTPVSGVATNLTGTAANLTAGAVTSIGNLTGPVTSVNRATSIAANALTISMTSGLQTALNGKANLSGGNDFVGNQKVDGTLAVTGVFSVGVQNVTMGSIVMWGGPGGSQAEINNSLQRSGFVALPVGGEVLATQDGEETFTSKTLISPILDGIPVAPTAAPATNTTQVATTEFVQAAVVAAGGGVTDHGLLTGLADDDHPQYVNRTTAQTIAGNKTWSGTASFSTVVEIEAGASVNFRDFATLSMFANSFFNLGDQAGFNAQLGSNTAFESGSVVSFNAGSILNLPDAFIAQSKIIGLSGAGGSLAGKANLAGGNTFTGAQQINGPLNVTASSGNTGVYGESETAQGVIGYAWGIGGIGVAGTAESGVGVWATSTTGVHFNAGSGKFIIGNNGDTTLTAKLNVGGQTELAATQALTTANSAVTRALGDARYATKMGVTDGSSAAAGEIGEYYESNIAIASGGSTNNANNVVKNITSLALPAGDWDVQGAFGMQLNGATSNTGNIGGISTTSATFNLGWEIYGPIGTPATSGTIPTRRFSFAVPTTVYLLSRIDFTGGGPPKSFGWMSARRVR